MNKKPEEKELKSAPEEKTANAAVREESGTSEKAEKKQKDTKKILCDNVFACVNDFKVGALYSGVENVLNGSKKIDARITRGVNGLLSNLTGYFRNSIDEYKKQESNL